MDVVIVGGYEMVERRSAIENAVISAMTGVALDSSVEVSASVEVLGLVDSMGLFSALVDIQETLQLTLEPEELIELFRCELVGDVISVLEREVERARARLTGCAEIGSS